MSDGRAALKVQRQPNRRRQRLHTNQSVPELDQGGSGAGRGGAGLGWAGWGGAGRGGAGRVGGGWAGLGGAGGAGRGGVGLVGRGGAGRGGAFFTIQLCLLFSCVGLALHCSIVYEEKGQFTPPLETPSPPLLSSVPAQRGTPEPSTVSWCQKF